MVDTLKHYLSLKKEAQELEFNIIALSKELSSHLLTVDELQTQIADTTFELQELKKRIAAMEKAAGACAENEHTNPDEC